MIPNPLLVSFALPVSSFSWRHRYSKVHQIDDRDGQTPHTLRSGKPDRIRVAMMPVKGGRWSCGPLSQQCRYQWRMKLTDLEDSYQIGYKTPSYILLPRNQTTTLTTHHSQRLENQKKPQPPKYVQKTPIPLFQNHVFPQQSPSHGAPLLDLHPRRRNLVCSRPSSAQHTRDCQR